jgi:osmoprotectant transport system permease protein
VFDNIVAALVERLAPLLMSLGNGVCAHTPGLVNQWPTYDFMCRNMERLAELTVQHITLTIIAMLIAILLGVLIGVRVSSPPWPHRSSLWFWPVISLVLVFVVAGVVALITLPAEGSAIEQFSPPNVRTWGALLGAGEDPFLFRLAVLVQSAAALGLAAVLIAGFLPGEADWRLVGAALAGAILGPALIPHPILHTLLLQVYRLLAALSAGPALLSAAADVLNWLRDAAPLWALIVLLLVMGKLTKQITWRSYLAAVAGAYAIVALLGVFVVRPGSAPVPALIQMLLFAVFAVMIVFGERSADPVLYVVGVIFTIPSLAMFGIMIPIIGIGVEPAVIALVLYGLLPILRNTITALRELDPSYSEAGRGMGMTDLQLLTRVQLPLALPVILAGVRVSTVMTVGIASIATLIGGGGLGELIFQGINRTQPRMVLTGAIWIAVLALLFDFILGQGEIRWVSKGIRPDRGVQSIQDVQEVAGV